MATAAESTNAKTSQSARIGNRVHTLTGIQVLSLASYAPEQVVRNEDLAALGYDDKWIIQRTGIRERRRAPIRLATSDLAFKASQRCLDQAGVASSDVDFLIVATVTPDSPMPSTACHLQRMLGTHGPAMDVNAACSGFIYAMATAAQFVKTGFSRLALVVGADIMSRVVNPRDEKTFPLFGDAAGAALIGRGKDDQGFLAYAMGSDGHGADMLGIPGGGSREPFSPQVLAAERQFMQMDGRSVFKWAVRTVADTILDVMAHAHVAPTAIDLVALHQANVRIINAVSDDLGFDRSKVLVNVDRYGNTSAASIPLVLDEAQSQGRLSAGSLVLMSGFGAGLTWGTCLFRW